jgi:hypothetical protein
MKKIFSKHETFSLVSSDSVYEQDYENQILRFSRQLFPEYYCRKFKTKVTSLYGNCKPDLVLIHKEYKDWYIVEVELEHHSLNHHVLDQVQKMYHGEYGETHVRYLLENNSDFDESRIRQLVRQKPRTLVIVPTSKNSWRESLYPYQTKIMTIQVWKNEKQEALLQVDGDELLQYRQELISILEIDPTIPRLLRVKNMANIPDSGIIQVDISGSRTDWRIQNFGHGKWLNPDGKSPLPNNVSGVFYLLRAESGEYYMEANK